MNIHPEILGGAEVGQTAEQRLTILRGLLHEPPGEQARTEVNFHLLEDDGTGQVPSREQYRGQLQALDEADEPATVICDLEAWLVIDDITPRAKIQIEHAFIARIPIQKMVGLFLLKNAHARP